MQYLRKDIEEEIYILQPLCFTMKGKENLVFKLKKSKYGFKESPTMCYYKFVAYVLGPGYTRSGDSNHMYTKQVGDHFFIMVLYVDDMLLIGNTMEIIKDAKS